MNDKLSAVAVSLVLTLLGQPCASAAESSEAVTLQGLLQEGHNLETQLRKVRKVKEEIDDKESGLKGAARALELERAASRERMMGLKEQQEEIEQKDRNSGCRWGTWSKDLAYVNSCNALLEKLKGWSEEVRTKAMSQIEFERKLQEQQNRLSDATVAWARLKSENNADINELSAAYSDWRQRYNDFVFQSETYERLKKTAPGARLCERLSGSGTYPELRSASQCLQWLFDGAQR